MVTACLCLSLNRGVKLVALASIILGIGICGVSSWILHRSMQAKKNPTLITAKELLHHVDTFYGGTTSVYDLDIVYRILIACSGAALCAGFLQFIMSFWLLLASVKGGRIMSRIWVVIHVAIMLCIGGVCLCILTNELEITKHLQYFLIINAADFVFLIYFCWVVFSYSYVANGRNSDSNGALIGNKSSVAYHTPPGNLNLNLNGNNVNNGGGVKIPTGGKSVMV